jgi:sortase (surface protein transpeptidase)
VIAGHVDSTAGPAVFFSLRTLVPGELVSVERGGVWVDFRVTQVEEYPKDQFPTDQVYRPTPDPELRVITCGGDFDTVHKRYYDNVVVYAILA